MGFDMMFGFMGFFVPVVMVLIFGLILFQIGRGVKQWNKNNNSPVLSVDAQVVAKRTKSPTTTRTTRWPAPLPPITLRSRWRVATGWNLPSGGRNMGCWPKGTGAS